MESLIKITGLLTSRIETRQDKIADQTYYYGFFKIEGYEQDIPVIFKNQVDEYYKPTLKKGTQVELTGFWSQGEDRPSFTCLNYKIINPAESTKEKSNIYQKLHFVQSQTGKIAKSELNKYQNYRYFTEQQALNILKPLLAEQKLTLTFSDVCEPTKDYHNRGELEKEKQEKEWVISYLKQATLTNSEKPEEQLTFHFWACGQNNDLAKAKGCAETYAIKYFLTKFFLIPTTDELDPDVTKDHEHLNRLKDGRQETKEEIQKRHEERDKKRIAELKAKYGSDWKLSQEYKSWRGNL